MIIYKILDSVQYKLSPGFKNIDINDIIANHKLKKIYDKNYFDFFASADAVETNLDFSKDANYIIPFFYNHAEQLESLPNWKYQLNSFIKKYKWTFDYANLAICDPLESTQHFIDSTNELETNAIFISANKKMKNAVFTDSWLPRFAPLNIPIEYNIEKLYINLSRVARYHRCRLLDALICNNLHTKGYNTWGNVYNKFNEYKAKHKTKIDTIDWDILDIKDLSMTNPNNSVPLDYCKKSFLYIATETSVNPNQLFFSEKTYKPIALGMPFINLGNPGTLKDLQARGFMTFDNFWNEDYDLDLNLDDRIKIIIENLIMLDSEDLNKLRNNMEKICSYNLNLYKETRLKNTLRENLDALFNNS